MRFLEEERCALVVLNPSDDFLPFFFFRYFNNNKQAGASKRVLQAKQKKFNSNIHKRGLVDINSSTKDKEKFTVGPVVLAFFIFVVIGSSLLQMIRTLQTGKP